MAQTYTVTLQSDKPFSQLAGMLESVGNVLGLKKEIKRVSASELAKETGLSVSTIREKLKLINEGTDGKHIYEHEKAMLMLKSDGKSRRGAKRKN